MELEIWAEKYRPEKLAEIINQKHVVERIKAFVNERNIPHMIFAGPPGTGKCVSSDTPIFLGNGEILPINEIRKNDDVLCLSPDGTIKTGKVLNLIGRKDETLKIKTKLGNEVKVTKEHPFLVLDNGIPCWKEAIQLKPNSLIATPLFLPIKNDCFVDFRGVKNLWAEVKEPKVVKISTLYEGIKKKVLEELFHKDGLTNNQLAFRIKAKKCTVGWATRSLHRDGVLHKNGVRNIKYSIKSKYVSTRKIPIEFLEEGDSILKISYKGRFSNFSIWVRPFSNTSEFYEWLGFLLAEGTIETSRLVFHNKNKLLLNRFFELTKSIFGIVPEKKENGIIIKRATTITKILQKKFNVYLGRKKKSHNIRVPKSLFSCSKEKIASFIRAYFDGDGSISKNQIEISSVSKRILFDLKILLLYFGIISKISSKRVHGRNYYRLTISGQKNIKTFREKIGSLIWIKKFQSSKEGTNIDVLQINPKLIYYVLNSLGINQIDILKKKEMEYVLERKRASRKKVQKIYSLIVFNARKKLSQLLDLYFLFQFFSKKIHELDNISKIESILEELKDRNKRKIIENEVGIRCDHLLEYSQGKHIPTIKSFLKILKVLCRIRKDKLYEKIYHEILFILSLREKILQAIELLKISYNFISKEINLPSASIMLHLKEDNCKLFSLNKILQIFNFIQKQIEARIFDEKLINILELFEFLANACIFWDRVDEIKESGREEVYDLEIEGSHNFIGGYGPMILHNTTCALALANELYGKEWRQNVLETNASDARGIDVIRGQIKSFARTKPIGEVPFRIIILDEADNLTNDAQQALRRTMEAYTAVSRFILIGNFSSKIIEPIQSRCAVFRFKSLSEADIRKFIERIVKGEKLKITEDGIKAIIEISEGDLRKVANLLQASAALKEKITEDVVYEAASKAKPTDVKEMLENALKGKFDLARKKLQDLLLVQGLAGSDVIAEIHKQIYSLPISEEAKVQLVEKCGEYEFRISEGSNELIQLEALLAQFLLFSKKK